MVGDGWETRVGKEEVGVLQRGPGGEGRSTVGVDGMLAGGGCLEPSVGGGGGGEGRPGLSGKTDELGERQLRALSLWEGSEEGQAEGFICRLRRRSWEAARLWGAGRGEQAEGNRTAHLQPLPPGPHHADEAGAFLPR